VQSNSPRTTPAPGAWSALFVTTLLFFLVVVDVSAVNVAFPSIAEDLNASETDLSWIISGYNITVGSLLLIAGRLADSHGRKKLFIPGVAVFMVGSALTAVAPTLPLIISARLVQAVGGAIIAPTALAVILPDWPANRRSMVIGLAGATGALGAVAGPAIGSVLIDAFSWRAIFWINVPICMVVLAISPRLLRESRNPAATGRIDLLGVPLGTTAIALVMLAIVQSESRGLNDAPVIGLLLVGIILFPLFLWRSARHPEPLLELHLFRFRSYRSTSMGVAFYSLAFTAGFLANSLFLQYLWDLPISRVGPALGVAPLFSAAISPLSGRLADRVGHRWLLAGGSLLLALSYALFPLVLTEEVRLWDRFVPITLIGGVGVGATIAIWAAAGLSDIPTAHLGTANATVRSIQQVGYAMGISLSVTILGAAGGSFVFGAYRAVWMYVGTMYLAAALVTLLTFPTGSSSDRALEQQPAT